MTTRWRCSRQKRKGEMKKKNKKPAMKGQPGIERGYRIYTIWREYEEGDGNKETKSRMTPPLLAWREQEQERGYIRS